MTTSIGQTPLRLIRGFIDAKWTKEKLSWTIAYVYSIYVILGAIPPLRGTVAFSVTAASALLVVLYLFHSFTNLSFKTASKFLVIAATISYIWEFIGVQTGVPFGPYNYTSALGPQIGPVPIAIPLIWCALGYFCLQASDYYIMASVLMVSLDLSFDPVFSTSLHLWNWTGQTQYFGVPLSNFFGWFIASLTFFAVFYFTTKYQATSSRRAILFYYLFGIDNVVGDLVSGSIALAAASFVIFTAAMAAVLILRRNKFAKTRLTATQQVSSVSRQPMANA